MNCSRCGKNLRMESKTESTYLIGIKIKLADLKSSPEMRRQLGKYAPPDTDDEVEFNFCFECWLDSLMGGSNDYSGGSKISKTE